MKNRIQKLVRFILCVAFSITAVAQQSNDDTCTIQPFEVYIDDTDFFSNIREHPNGKIILKLNNSYGYGYILNVINYKEGWLKINSIKGVDTVDISNFEGWVHSTIVGASNTYDMNLLDTPNGKKTANIIGEQGETFKIKEVHCEWIQIDLKGIIGWVKSSEICGSPVTTCP